MAQSRHTWSEDQEHVGLRRRKVVSVLLVVLFAVFAARIVLVQAVQGPALAEQARSERLRTYTIEAPRGAILDTRGEVLAMSGERVNVAVNQRAVARFLHTEDGEVVGTGAAAAAKLLAPILGRDRFELGGEMVGDSTWHYLVKDLQPSQWREIRELGIPGIEPEWIAVREYPNGPTAGNVVGFTGRDHFGLGGLEQAYNETLTGVPGSETVEIGNGGQVIPTGTNELTEALPGATLNTTIDRDLQYLAQQQVDEAVRTYGAQWAAVAVMEVGTGNVLVLADSGTVDPNNPGASNTSDRGARSVTSPYEPGSTGKLLTVAAALNEGVITPSSTFHVPGQATINGQVFREHTWHEPLDLTPTGVLATSSNIGTIEIGRLMDDEVRYQYMRDFGFGERSGIGLPGESPGLLTIPDPHDGRTRFVNMFGQGYAITLIQNVAMVATIGNGGVYQTPRLVSSIENGDGTITYPEFPEDRTVLTPETSETLLAMMESVVTEGGTGTRADIDGYRVAGKTGTAQTADASGQLTQTVANFVGIVPADNPRFAVAVVVYKPQSGFYGGTIAAPIFQTVARDALTRYGVAPSETPPPQLPWTADGRTTL
ncbi:MAG TPA: penicillin-binding protein 2 [Actinomycetales bacterium]|nr:penicillin-binding protein 2 [Actinomycetales bacterium]